jgi:hypothetical protein
MKTEKRMHEKKNAGDDKNFTKIKYLPALPQKKEQILT